LAVRARGVRGGGLLSGCAVQGNCISDALVAGCCAGCALGQMLAQIEEEEGGGGGEDGEAPVATAVAVANPVDSGVVDMER
jgi:hypothetical protein